MMTPYLAVTRDGDLFHMGLRERNFSFLITTKEELALWRTFNRLGKTYTKAAGTIANATYSSADLERYNEAFDAYSAAHRAMASHYDHLWSKYHARTTWVVVKP